MINVTHAFTCLFFIRIGYINFKTTTSNSVCLFVCLFVCLLVGWFDGPLARKRHCACTRKLVGTVLVGLIATIQLNHVFLFLLPTFTKLCRCRPRIQPARIARTPPTTTPSRVQEYEPICDKYNYYIEFLVAVFYSDV